MFHAICRIKNKKILSVVTVPARPGIPADSGIGSNDLGGPGQEPLPPGAALPPRATPNGHFLRRGGRQGLRAALVQADGAGGGSIHSAGSIAFV